MRTNDGRPFATVSTVLVDERVSVFDGIVVETADGARFIDADEIGTIHTTYVGTTLSAEQAADLPAPDGSSLIEIKPSRSIADRVGRMFGRGRR